MKETRYQVVGNIATYPLLLAGAIIAVFSFTGLSLNKPVDTGITLVTNNSTVTVGSSFTVDVIVSSDVAVNVFAGNINYDQNTASVKEIEYNTSIANLWTEEPWYKNGDGTIKFAGGTTEPGGFVGNGKLMTITFEAENIGRQNLTISNAHILEHDGLGTETNVLNTELFITINTNDVNVAMQSVTIFITDSKFDLTGDNKVGLADISAFFTAMFRNDLRADFNNDGKVNTADLSLLLPLLGKNIKE